MAFTKITNQELNSRGATTLPNQPKISATALKQEFDAPAKNIVAPKFNNLIDELEATTGAASLGIVTPTGRTGETVQAVIDDISDDLATLEAGVGPAIAEAHTHPNKELLDTYTQTEEALASAVADDHTHANKSTLDKFSDVSGVPYYNGAPIAGSGEMAIDGSNAAADVTFSGTFTAGDRRTGTFGTKSTVLGHANVASGNYSCAMGEQNTASYAHAHAEGYGTTASDEATHAEGFNTTANSTASHAEGVSTTASGWYSHSEGDTTTASGTAAHAEGSNTTASGSRSHTSGHYTTAGYADQTVIGKYNSNQSSTLFEVGNGTSTSARSNALEVYSNGDINVQGQILRNGAPEYLENNSVTLSTSGTTTVTFTNAAITANSMIGYACTQWGIFPDDITASAGTCTVTMPQVDSAVTVGVRIILR